MDNWTAPKYNFTKHTVVLGGSQFTHHPRHPHMLYGDQFYSFICSLFHSLIACSSFQFVSLSHLTFLTGILMTITAFYVIPFIFIFNTKCMHTVFIPKIVRLVFSPSCKVPSTTICPSKGALCENIIQSQPGFCSIVKML